MSGSRPDVSRQLPEEQARKLAVQILREGSTVFTKHCRREMADDGLLETDVVNTIAGGLITEPGEISLRGGWRYRVRTRRITVVIEFRSNEEMVIVTAWRESRSE
jgi:hypothetical protein